MFVALDDLVARTQLFIVLIFNPQRSTDLLDDLLVRRGIVATRGFLAAEVRAFEVNVHIAAGDGGRHAGVLLPRVGDRLPSRPRG